MSYRKAGQVVYASSSPDGNWAPIQIDPGCEMKIWNELSVSARKGGYAALIFLLAAGLAFFCFFVVVLLILRFVDPPMSAVMLRDRLAGGHVQHHWTPINMISENLIRAVISSEDARFCNHFGVDLYEWRRVMRVADRDGIDAVRGASTITMQVAKNLFLWTDRSLARKGLELAITPIIELVWPKRRILEGLPEHCSMGPGPIRHRCCSTSAFQEYTAGTKRSPGVPVDREPASAIRAPGECRNAIYAPDRDPDPVPHAPWQCPYELRYPRAGWQKIGSLILTHKNDWHLHQNSTISPFHPVQVDEIRWFKQQRAAIWHRQSLPIAWLRAR